MGGFNRNLFSIWPHLSGEQLLRSFGGSPGIKVLLEKNGPWVKKNTHKKCILTLRHRTTSITLKRFLSSWNPGKHFTCVTSLGPQDTLMEIPRLSSLCALGRLRLRDFFQGRTAPKWQGQESNTGLTTKSLLLTTVLSFRHIH